MVEGVRETLVKDPVQSCLADRLQVLEFSGVNLAAHVGGLHLEYVIISLPKEVGHVHTHLIIVVLLLEAEIEVVLCCYEFLTLIKPHFHTFRVLDFHGFVPNLALSEEVHGRIETRTLIEYTFQRIDDLRSCLEGLHCQEVGYDKVGREDQNDRKR